MSSRFQRPCVCVCVYVCGKGDRNQGKNPARWRYTHALCTGFRQLMQFEHRLEEPIALELLGGENSPPTRG